MLRKLLITLLLCSPAFSWGADLFVGDKAENFTLKSNLGENLRLSEQRGQIVFVTFWASWCGPCKEQLKDLETLYQQHKDKGFKVWAISLDEDLKEVAYHANEMPISFPVLYDNKHETAKAYQVDDLPSVAIVDRDGIIRFVGEEYKNKHFKQYAKQVNKLVNE